MAKGERAKEAANKHPFGGPWTEVKLDAVQYYLECYAKALTWAGMDIWYIDAFAGTGDREAEREIGGIFENRPIETIDVQVIRGEANSTLVDLVGRPPWNARDRSRSRGVVFLDPYALEVEWATLQALAGTKALDVWYLFPLEAVLRQLARNFSGVGVKAPKLDRVLSTAWRDLYSLPSPQPMERLDIFDHRPEEELRRDASAKQVEEWFQGELAKVFPYVPKPVPILRSTNRQMFSLFLCVSNPSKAATDLADSFMRYVKQGRQPASRRRSDR